jgi:hypothetical protein
MNVMSSSSSSSTAPRRAALAMDPQARSRTSSASRTPPRHGRRVVALPHLPVVRTPQVKVGGAKVAAGGGSSSARLTSVSRTRSSISSARASSWATPATTSSALEKTFAASSGKN